MFTVQKIFRSDKVRRTCIAHDWYTCGDTEQYSRMLRAADLIQGEDLKQIESIARDIYSHTDIDTMYPDEKEPFVVAMMMSVLIDNCVDTYVVLEG